MLPWLLSAAELRRAPPRMAGFDGSAWDEEEEEPAPDHQYYNDFPGKEPPIGGVVDMRLREGAAQTPNHLGATLVRPGARLRGVLGGRFRITRETWGPRWSCGLLAWGYSSTESAACVSSTSRSPGWGLGACRDPLGSLTVCLSLQPIGQTSGGEYDPRKQHAPAQGNAGDVAVPVLLSCTPNRSSIERWCWGQGRLEPR